MFPGRFFPTRFFPDRYFAKTGAEFNAPPSGEQSYEGSYFERRWMKVAKRKSKMFYNP